MSPPANGGGPETTTWQVGRRHPERNVVQVADGESPPTECGVLQCPVLLEQETFLQQRAP